MNNHLDPRLRNDTFDVTRGPLSSIQLMNDARFLWLILVPQMLRGSLSPHIEELSELTDEEAKTLLSEVLAVTRVLQAHASPTKVNVGALGNIVRQLHVHVIARFETDAAWPGPVWGFGTRQPYEPEARDQLLSDLRPKLDAELQGKVPPLTT